MIFINKHSKLRSHIVPMPIKDIPIVNKIKLICNNSAKFFLYGVNGVYFKTTTTLLAALSAGAKTNFLWNSWTHFLKFLKVNLRFVIQYFVCGL